MKAEVVMMRTDGGPHPGDRLVDTGVLPWPLPDALPDEGGQYVKVSESQIPHEIPGVLRGAQYRWEPE